MACRVRSHPLRLPALRPATNNTMEDLTAKEIIEAGYALVDAFRRARKPSTKATLKKQAKILFNEVGYVAPQGTFA